MCWQKQIWGYKILHLRDKTERFSEIKAYIYEKTWENMFFCQVATLPGVVWEGNPTLQSAAMRFLENKTNWDRENWSFLS